MVATACESGPQAGMEFCSSGVAALWWPKGSLPAQEACTAITSHNSITPNQFVLQQQPSAVGPAIIPTLGRPVVPLVNIKLARSSLHRAAKGSQTWHTERTAPAPAMKRARHSQTSTSSCALRIGRMLHYLCSSGACQVPVSTILRPCTAVETTHHCIRCQRTVQLCRQLAWGHGRPLPMHEGQASKGRPDLLAQDREIVPLTRNYQAPTNQVR